MIVARGLAALALGCALGACTSTGDSQVIFVPTGDGGVQAETVHTGRAPAASGATPGAEPRQPPIELREEPDPSAVRRRKRETVLSDSDILNYRGAASETLFITSTAILADIGSNIGDDFVREGALCPSWGNHLREVTERQRLIRCREYSVTAARVNRQGASRPPASYRIIGYEFEGVERECDTFDRCTVPPLSHPAILELPVCVTAIVHTFESADGGVHRLIESTDPSAYAAQADVGAISDAARSRSLFGVDFSKIKTMQACNEFAKGNAR